MVTKTPNSGLPLTERWAGTTGLLWVPLPVLTVPRQGRYSRPHFTDEDSEAQRVFKARYLVNGPSSLQRYVASSLLISVSEPLNVENSLSVSQSLLENVHFSGIGCTVQLKCQLHVPLAGLEPLGFTHVS